VGAAGRGSAIAWGGAYVGLAVKFDFAFNPASGVCGRRSMKMSEGKGPFIFVAVVIIGCLGAGVALATFIDQVAAPVQVGFTDPQGSGRVEIARRPNNPDLRLRIEKRDDTSFLIVGVDADASRDGLGYVQSRQLRSVVGSFGELAPDRIYGPQRLHLVAEGELSEETPREWGSSGRCLGTSLPMRLRVVRFVRGYADYEVFPCGSGDAGPSHESSLSAGDAELVRPEIRGETRHFLIAAVLAADHVQSPFWSSFLVAEMTQG